MVSKFAAEQLGSLKTGNWLWKRVCLRCSHAFLSSYKTSSSGQLFKLGPTFSWTILFYSFEWLPPWSHWISLWPDVQPHKLQPSSLALPPPGPWMWQAQLAHAAHSVPVLQRQTFPWMQQDAAHRLATCTFLVLTVSGRYVCTYVPE